MPEAKKRSPQSRIEDLHGNLLYCREDATSLGFELEANLIDAAIAGVEEEMPSRTMKENTKADAA